MLVEQLITQRSSVQIRPPQPIQSGGYGSDRSPFFFPGCAWVASGRIVEPIDSLSVGSWNEVAIDVYGDLDGGVPHLLLHVRRALALLEQQAGERVAQVVEADATQASR